LQELLEDPATSDAELQAETPETLTSRLADLQQRLRNRQSQ